jgi:DNA-binding transcriptional MerR regulator
MKNQRTLYTVGQAARKLNLTLNSMRSYVRDGLPVERDGLKIRVYIPDAENWLVHRQGLKRSYDLAIEGIARLMDDGE